MTMLFLLIATLFLFPADGAAGAAAEISTAAESEVAATSPPDSVLTQFFSLLRAGQSEEAQELFLVRNSDQRSSVRDHVEKGISFFANSNVRNLVVEVFEKGRFSICAIEQTSRDFPGKFELERGILMFTGGRWRLLPKPQDYRDKLNGLSRQEKAELDLLQEEFAAFKRNYKGSGRPNRE